MYVGPIPLLILQSDQGDNSFIDCSMRYNVAILYTYSYMDTQIVFEICASLGYSHGHLDYQQLM